MLQGEGGVNLLEPEWIQAAADAAETAIEDAPTGGEALDDILSDLGIN